MLAVTGTAGPLINNRDDWSRDDWNRDDWNRDDWNRDDWRGTGPARRPTGRQRPAFGVEQ